MEVTIIIPALTLSIIFPEKTIVISQVMMGIRNLGEIGGDMFKSVYDPNDIGADAFSMANMQETESSKIFTSNERVQLEDCFKHINSPHTFEAFPVGSIYISILDTDPGTSLGYGIWQRFGNGRVLIGVDEHDNDFRLPELTGGAKSDKPSGENSAQTFTGNAMGNHQHDAVSAGTPSGTVGSIIASLTATLRNGTAIGNVAAATHTHPAPTFTGNALATHQHAAISAGTPSGSVSKSQFSGNNMSLLNPYITVYMWLTNS